MDKIVLINPPQPNSLDDRLDPPLSLMYLAASLKENGINPRIVDLASVPKENWKIQIGKAEFYGIGIFSPSFYVCKEINNLARGNNPSATLVAGGPHATSLPYQTLKEGNFDYVIQGEAEYALPYLINSLEKNLNIPKIINFGQIKNLDNLPFPARELVNLNSYHRKVQGKHATTMISSRGCPFTCNFCCKDVHGKKIRYRSVSNFLGEVEDIIYSQKIRNFLFYDDVFTFNLKGRLKKITDEFKKLDINFRCNGRAGINNFEEYLMLKDAGCEEIAFGIESGSESQLKRMGKGTNLKKNYFAITEAKRAGLSTKAYLISGFPGETESTIRETIDFIKETNPDKFTIFGFVPLPGSDTWKYPEKYNITYISKDWAQYFNIAGQYEGGLTFETKNTSKNELKRLHDLLVTSLLERGQRGPLEDYYGNLNFNG